jgi:hypothetical protein
MNQTPLNNADAINITGNPFVDVGLAVIASIAELDDIEELTLGQIKETHALFEEELLDVNERLKSFTMIFTKNSLLVHPSMKPREMRRPAYRAVLNHLLNSIGQETRPEICESCGNARSVDFDALCTEALAGLLPERRFRAIGRDWFPLAGSLGSDAQALPAASRSVNLCATCLFAVHYLPLGLILLNGRLAVFQSTSLDLWYNTIRSITEETKSRALTGHYDIIGKKEGSKIVIQRLLAVYRHMPDKKGTNGADEQACVFVYRFSNAGAGPDCDVDVIPNQALGFLREAGDQGFGAEIEDMLNVEKSRSRFSLYRSLIEGDDYFSRYPQKKKQTGASVQLYRLYQTKICGQSDSALDAAALIAKKVSMRDEKKLKQLKKERALEEFANRSAVRTAIISAIRTGEMTFQDYEALFPRVGDTGVAVSGTGWNLISYYLHHINDPDSIIDGAVHTRSLQSQDVAALAYTIYTKDVLAYGAERLKKRIDQIKRSDVGLVWLRNQFTSLAEKYTGLSYAQWEKLAKDARGALSVTELLFQLRLLLTQFLYQQEPRVDSVVVAGPEGASSDGLPPVYSALIGSLFEQYQERVGLDGIYKQVLQQLKSRKKGLWWFKQRFATIAASLENVHFDDDVWEEFLLDENGQSLQYERLFQFHLAIANLYRKAQDSGLSVKRGG